MSRCAKCGSSRLMTDAAVFSHVEGSKEPVEAGFQKDPSAMIFKGTVSRTLRAAICADCGYVELYLQDAGHVYDAYLKARGEGV